MGLEPYLLSRLARLQKWDMAEEHNTIDCIECGCCAYVCPASVPLVLAFRSGKQILRNAMAAKK